MIFQLLLILLLSVSVGLVLWLLERSMREISKLKSHARAEEEALQKRSEKIIAEANASAMKIIQEAHIRAEKIQSELDSKLDAVNKQELKDYKETIQNISKDIEKEALREIQNMQSALKSQTIDVQEIVGKRVDDSLQMTLAEINSYKEKKIAEINNRMLGFIKELALKAIGVSIDATGQTDLVLKSLAEAKESHVF